MITIVYHRINTTRQLKTVPERFGVEIDVRAYGNKLVLHHEAMQPGEELEEYLKHYHHRFLMFNIKESGIEQQVIDLAKKYKLTDYFLFDVEFDFIYRAARAGFHQVAIRYSEEECIDTVLHYKGKIDWVWMNTLTKLPLDKKVVEQLRGFKVGLVCPERWGRPQDIPVYIQKMKELNFKPELVMTSASHVAQYEQSGL